MLRAVLLAGFFAVLALSLPASPANAGPRIDAAVSALRESPVYVQPGASPTLTPEEAERLHDRIRRGDAGPVFVAILSSAALEEAGGDANAVLREVVGGLRRHGSYAVVVAGRFRATSDVVPEAGTLATEAFRAHARDGLAATLEDFVDRVTAARQGAGGGGGAAEGDGGGGPSTAGVLGLLALLGTGAGFAVWRTGRRRRAEQERQVEELRAAARDDLVALGDDVRSVDLDIEMPGADPRARAELERGLAAYDRAEQALDRARSPEDFEPITQTVAEGRQAMARTRALLDGREPEEDQPLCFFDPRHGPAVTWVEWAPPGGEPRKVPVCAADAARLARGEDPQVREVMAGGRSMPYYDAPGHFGPWAGGFFGGGGSMFLPGLLGGTLLGGALFGAGPAWGSESGGEGREGGDGAGGDFGDFGGGDFGGADLGGGDFGGGDFGAGDLGGGDFGGGDFGE